MTSAPKPASHDRPAWASVVAREPDALEGLFSEWIGVTLQWCRRLGGPRVDADQAAQEVFMVVLRRIHTVNNENAFPTWLFAVTRRVLAQHRRHVWGTRWAADSNLDHFADARLQDDPERRETIQVVWSIIDELPDELREVLVLCDLEDRSDPEAANLLGLPIGTTKSRLRRARQLFKRRAKSAGLQPQPSSGTP